MSAQLPTGAMTSGSPPSSSMPTHPTPTHPTPTLSSASPAGSASPAARTSHAPDPTTAFRRRATAVTLPLAFAFQVVANGFYARAADGGVGDTGTGAQAMQFYAEHPRALLTATVLSLVGSLLAVAGLPAALRLVRPTRPRLGLTAVVLMTAGYVVYFGIVMTNFLTLALAEEAADAGSTALAGAVLDSAQQMGAALPFLLVFVLGNLVGTALLGVAVFLSPGLPRWAGILVLGWPVGHVVNLVVGQEWFAVAGGSLEVVGLVALAGVALRLGDEEWVRRG